MSFNILVCRLQDIFLCIHKYIHTYQWSFIFLLDLNESHGKIFLNVELLKPIHCSCHHVSCMYMYIYNRFAIAVFNSRIYHNLISHSFFLATIFLFLNNTSVGIQNERASVVCRLFSAKGNFGGRLKRNFCPLHPPTPYPCSPEFELENLPVRDDQR